MVTSNFRNCNAYFRENLKTVESFLVLWAQLQLLIVWGNFYRIKRNVVVVVWSLSHALNLCDPMDCSTPGFPVLHYLPEFAQTHVLWVGDAIQPSHPLSPLLLLPSVFPIIRVFSIELALCIRRPKYWSFSFSISPSSEYSGLISFKVDWFDLLVQGTLKSLLTKKNVQHILNGDSRII